MFIYPIIEEFFSLSKENVKRLINEKRFNTEIHKILFNYDEENLKTDIYNFYSYNEINFLHHSLDVDNSTIENKLGSALEYEDADENTVKPDENLSNKNLNKEYIRSILLTELLKLLLYENSYFNKTVTVFYNRTKPEKRGKIIKENNDNTVNILYNDNTEENNVHKRFIKDLDTGFNNNIINYDDDTDIKLDSYLDSYLDNLNKIIKNNKDYYVYTKDDIYHKLFHYKNILKLMPKDENDTLNNIKNNIIKESNYETGNTDYDSLNGQLNRIAEINKKDINNNINEILDAIINNNTQTEKSYSFVKIFNDLRESSGSKNPVVPQYKLPIIYNITIPEIIEKLKPRFFTKMYYIQPITSLIGPSEALFNYIFSNINVIINELHVIYYYVIDIIKETFCRLQYGKAICNNRTTEGKFINKSLQDAGDTIKEILLLKSNDVLFNSPEYIDICLKQYCPTNTDCFNIQTENTKINNTEIPSKIFNQMFKILAKSKNTKTKPKTRYTKEQFYQDIVVCIFCVLNISKTANNPPPVPYIDINKLKQIFYNKTSEDMRPYMQTALNKYMEFKEIINIDANTVEKIEIIIKDKENVERVRDYAFINNHYDKTLITKVNDFITQIDNINAATSIGTLEFIDKIAKFNTVNNTCFVDNKNKPIVDQYINSSGNNFRPLQYTKYI